MKNTLIRNIVKYVRSAAMLIAAIVIAVPASGQDIPDAEGLFTKKYISSFDYDTMEGVLTLETFVTGEMKLVSEPFDVVMVLDVSGSMSGKIDKLQAGAIAVLDQIYESNTSTSGTSRLGIVTFGHNDETDTRVVHKISVVNSSNYATIKSNIQNIRDGGATRSDLGFELSLEMLRNPSKNVTFDDVDGRELSDYEEIGYTETPFDRQTFVIFFTDGMPGNSRGEIETGETTLELAYVYKAKGAKIFSIGLFDNDPANIWIEEDEYEQALNVKDYLEHVSSLYNTVKKFDWGEDYVEWTPSNPVRNTDGVDYYLRVDNVNNLAETFASIGSQIIGVASKSLTTETVIKDIISADCTLPDGVKVEDVKVYSATCTGGNKTDGFTFGAKSDQSADVEIIVDENTVNVTDFDFGANWVGYDSSASAFHGKKLIIEIPFKVLPGALAGKDIKQLRTNGEKSGVYENGDSDDPIKPFPVPEIEYIDVTIKATGLHAGESAIFKVERKMAGESEFSYFTTIALTGTSDEGTEVSSTILYQDPEGEYKVTDISGWSWTYTIQGEASQTKTSEEGQPIVFEFSNTKTESITIQNAEKSKDNRFTTYMPDGITVNGNWMSKEKEL